MIVGNKKNLTGDDEPSRVVIARLMRYLLAGEHTTALREMERSTSGRLIRCLLDGSYTVQELAKKVGTGYRTIYRVIEACKQAGYRVKQSKNGKWSLSLSK